MDAQAAPSVHDHLAAKAPGTASIRVRQTQATTPPGTMLDEFTIAVTTYVL